MKVVGSLWILWVLLVHRAEADAEPISDPSLRPGQSKTEGESQAVSQGQYKCLELSNKDHQEHRTGTFCGPMWDGLLCWEETLAGTSATQNCPDHPDLDPAEKVTKYCDELGNWVETGSTCQPSSKDGLEKEDSHFLNDGPGEPTTEEVGFTEKMILENEMKCLEKMKQDPPYEKSGLYCGRNWDGWLCWDDTPAGDYASQNCPNYFVDLDPTAKATKYCGEDGQWFRHPENNKTWTNYTLCPINTEDKLKAAAQFSGDTEIKPSDGVTISPTVNQEEREMRRKNILDNQYKCFEKMNRDPPYNKSGPFCNRNWDGWLCWEDTPAGTFTSQNCPNYFPDFDPTERATKYCGEDGQWFRHPDTNRTWSNYTRCNAHTTAKLKDQAAGQNP